MKISHAVSGKMKELWHEMLRKVEESHVENKQNERCLT